MADDFQNAAIGPLQGGGGTPVAPQQSFGLRQLLEIAIPALAATAGTNKWAGTGAALTRGAVGGLAGYESQQPKALTGADRYHEALANHWETQNRIAIEKQRNVDRWLQSLPPDQRQAAALDPEGTIKLQHDQALRRPTIDHLTHAYGIAPEALAGQDNAHLQALSNGLIRDEQRAKAAGAKIYKPVPGTVLVNRDTMQPLGPQDDPSTGVPMQVLRSPVDGSIVGMTGMAPSAKDIPTVSDKPSVEWVNEAGELAKNKDPMMSVSDAKKGKYFAAQPALVTKLDQGKQALTMLSNMADVFDDLQKQGKMVDATGAQALVERMNIAWQNFTADPALNVAAANSSEMIAIQRALGDKMRAIQAFQGATDIIKAGKAQYPAVKQYLNQLDKAIRAGKPGQTPKAWEDVPGAREMGKDNTGTTNIPAGSTDLGDGFVLHPVH